MDSGFHHVQVRERAADIAIDDSEWTFEGSKVKTNGSFALMKCKDRRSKQGFVGTDSADFGTGQYFLHSRAFDAPAVHCVGGQLGGLIKNDAGKRPIYYNIIEEIE